MKSFPQNEAEDSAHGAVPSGGVGGASRRKRLARKLAYGKWLPSYVWQGLTRPAPKGKVHLIFALADHFEPAIVPENGRARASLAEQQRRVEKWCVEYPAAVGDWRDCEGQPFVHTYFYPAEQYDPDQLDVLADHCRVGWGEIEIHLHHGVDAPDTPENTRRQLLEFRDALSEKHDALCLLDGVGPAHYAFVHGNFALANSAGGYGCGVDSEMQLLAETGCYADFTLPAAAYHPAQVGKINSLYECALPLDQKAPHRRGFDLRVGNPPRTFPLIFQGPLLLDFDKNARNRILRIENSALTAANPPSLRRLQLWKKAAIGVRERPDWIFIKLHCHSMDPTQRPAVLGAGVQQFLSQLISGAAERQEVIHFVTAREMVNIAWAACDGRDGNPGDYRNYRLKLASEFPLNHAKDSASTAIARG